MLLVSEVSLDTVLGIIAILAGLAALVVALLTDKRVRATGGTLQETANTLTKVNKGVGATSGTLQETANTLTKVERGLSTHWVGDFPFFLGEVNEVLDSAEKSITVFCDLPGYAVYSDADGWSKYREIINAKRGRRHFDVEVICLVHSERETMHKDQFRDWDPTDAKLERFYEDHPPLPGATGDTDTAAAKAHFLTRLEEVQCDEEEYLHATPIDAIMPLYFWVADNKDAVFALTSFVEDAREVDAREVGFRTRDDRLIKALSGIYNRYKQLPPPASEKQCVPDRFVSGAGRTRG